MKNTKKTIKTRIMDFVEQHGDCSWSDIHNFILDLHGLEHGRKNRGYYSVNLFNGSPDAERGYLRKPSKFEPRYLAKNETTGRWYVKTGK